MRYAFRHIVSILLMALPIAAQCARWAQPEGTVGVDGELFTMVRWDPDGAGPLPAGVVCGGAFQYAGSIGASRVALLDPGTGTFTALGSGVDATVRCAAVLPSGELVVGGEFTTAGGQPASAIARWNGTSWSSLGGGLGGVVHSLLVLPNGDLIASGAFASAGGQPAGNVARWNGAVWSAVGGGTNGTVFASAVMPNGDLIVGGYFGLADGLPVAHLARWNGTAWSDLPGGGVSFVVRALQVTAAGSLAVGGDFNMAGGNPASFVAMWDGVAWSSLGSFLVPVQAMALDANGQLYAGSGAPPIGSLMASVARWNGSAWVPLNTTSPTLTRCLVCLPGNEVLSGGYFTAVGSTSVRNLARFDGASWGPACRGFDGVVQTLTCAEDGSVLAAGDFHHAGRVVAHRVARHDGVDWAPLGDGPGFPPVTIVGAASGEVFVAGGGNRQIARWDGLVWSSIGLANQEVNQVALLPDGDLVAAGRFTSISGVWTGRLARWHAGTWSSFAPGLVDSIYAPVNAMCIAPDGAVYVGGASLSSGGSPPSLAMRWDGLGWTSLALAGSEVRAMTLAADGSLYAAGAFTGSVFLAKWNGQSWSAAPNALGAWRAVATLPNGDLLAAGIVSTINGIAVNNIARWNGSAWSALGSGIAVVGSNLAPVLALAVAPSGRLFVGGDFRFVDGSPSNFLASYESTCPATVAVGAAGCSGVHGTSTFAGVDRPWLGASFHARGTGLPAPALVVVGSGLTPLQLPVGLLLSPSPPACTFALAYDAMDIQLTTSGTVDTVLALPNAPAFVGTVIYQQLLTIGIDAALQFGESTVSNSLVLTCGVF